MKPMDTCSPQSLKIFGRSNDPHLDPFIILRNKRLDEGIKSGNLSIWSSKPNYMEGGYKD